VVEDENKDRKSPLIEKKTSVKVRKGMGFIKPKNKGGLAISRKKPTAEGHSDGKAPAAPAHNVFKDGFGGAQPE